MDASFWRGRWRREETGWHSSTVNRHLERHWPSLVTGPGGRVLVPLCGKSLDLEWLADRGHEVVGVELSELACHQFFQDRDLDPEVSTSGAFQVHETPGMRLLCGDMFALTPGDVGEVSYWYDRAALIALSPAQRPTYERVMASALPSGARGLLIGLAYPPDQKSGPPFPVPEEEVLQTWSPDFDVEVVERADVVDDEPRFRQVWGLTELIQTLYVLRRR